jgi:hypothetical protein
MVVNARHFGVNGAQLALFLGPTLVGVTGLKLWERYYRRRFTPKGAPAARGSAATATLPAEPASATGQR